MRFSIRDLLWFTVVAAVAVGWWLDHRQLQQLRSENIKVKSYMEFYERQLIDTHTDGFVVPSGRVIPGSTIVKEK